MFKYTHLNLHIYFLVINWSQVRENLYFFIINLAQKPETILIFLVLSTASDKHHSYNNTRFIYKFELSNSQDNPSGQVFAVMSSYANTVFGFAKFCFVCTCWLHVWFATPLASLSAVPVKGKRRHNVQTYCT